MSTTSSAERSRGRLLPTLLLTSAALFMVTLDNLVVTTAAAVGAGALVALLLPSRIRRPGFAALQTAPVPVAAGTL
jgi:hypothetical protein